MATIKLRRGTSTLWDSENPVLAEGEIAVNTDDLSANPRFKIGDGSTLWRALPYANVGQGATGMTGVMGMTGATGSAIDYRENFVTTSGQTAVSVSTGSFTQDSKNLKVYYSGLMMTPGVDYNELSATTIQFVSGREVGKNVSLIWSK